MTLSPFHKGEQQVQSHLGVRDVIEPWARQVVRPYLPKQHQEFYSALPFVVAAARDNKNRPWVTLLSGAQGFIQSPSNKQLKMSTSTARGDALENAFETGSEVGLLGIELDARRRNRVNGTLTAKFDESFTFEVGQAFGNCPQYITERIWQHVTVDDSLSVASRHSVLDTAMQDWIQSADTFFIASGYHGDDDNPRTIGMDASHRGGQPGFVKVENSRRIIFPDYAGNNHFNTIGNLILEPGVGLLFVDFAKGDLLQITGRASIDWDSAEVANFPGAQRLVTIDIDEIVFLQCVLPLRWRKPVESNQTLKVANKIQESHDVISFELVSEDGKKLPEFKAGQYLPIEFETHDSRIQRTYSISNGTGSDHYRISVKREPRGLASRYLHDVVEPGDTIKAGTPMGDFVIGDTHRPVVLVSAGIGITPMISMLNQLGSLANNKPIYFFHGTRNSTSHAFSKYVNALAKTLPNLKIEFSYSRPNLNDKPEIDYQHTGHVSGERIRQLVQEHDACYYLCGPPGFISEVSNSLVSDGVDQASIYLETFGSAN